MENADAWRIAEWIASAAGVMGALFAALLGWLGSYHVGRLDTTIERVDDIRESYVTREEFIAAFIRTDRATETRHGENVAWLRRIEDTIQKNADDAKTDRHAVATAVTAIGIQVATLVGRSQATDKGG